MSVFEGSRNDYKYFRCDTCGLLLTDGMIRKGICVGHKVRPAIRGTLWEWLLIKLGLYERVMRIYGQSE